MKLEIDFRFAVSIALALLLAGWLAGCGHSVKVTPPPPPVYTGVSFTWSAPELPSLPDCTLQASEPCLRYDLIDKATGLTVGHPLITDHGFLLKPAPTTWPHSYSLVLGLVSNDGSFSPCAHPPLAVLVVP